MRRRALIAALALAAGVFPAASALARCEGVAPEGRPQNTPRDYVGETLDEIVARGTLTVAVYADFPPYSWLDGETPKGVDIAVGHILAKALGVVPEFRFADAGETVDVDLMVNVWRGGVQKEPVANVMLRVPYDRDYACKIDQVVFTGQYAMEEMAIAYRLDAYPDAMPKGEGRDEGAPVPAFFRYDTVAVENDSISDFYLTSFPGGDIGGNVHRFPSMAQGMAALAAGETMAAMGPLAQLQFGAGEGVRVHRPPLPGFAKGKWTLGLAVHTSHRDLAYALDDAVAAALADGRIAKAYADYGLTFLPPDR
jgi:ABC-type amino acid transport substrate-binding protein